MGWKYDSNVIYGSEKANKNSFMWDQHLFYTTKTGKLKKRKGTEKAITVAESEYNIAWEKYEVIFN